MQKVYFAGETAVLKTVLVALDSSAIADRVIKTVQELVLPNDGKVVLCHVFTPPDLESTLPADRPQPESQAISYFHVEKQLQAYQDRLLVDSEVELVTGDPAEEIVRLSNIYKADLIVIGSRGLTGVERIVHGSVSSEVVETAPCSVLVVKG